MPDATPTPKGSGLRNRPTGEPPVTTPAPKAAPKAEPPAGPDVSAITAERDAAAARAETAERRLTAFTEFSGVLGTTESDVIDTFDAKYAAMPKADRPSRADWIKGLREKPESAPALLRPFLTTQAAEAAPGRPIGTMAGTGKKNEEAIPAECTAEWQRYGATLNISERDWFEKNWKPRHPPKKT